MTDQSRFTPWTPTDIRRAAAIWQRDFADHYGDGDGPWGAQSAVCATIGRAIGKTVEGVVARFLRFGPSFTAGPRGGPTEQTYADLERRNEARRRQDLTASVFGDPPPGYSALDKRRATGARR